MSDKPQDQISEEDKKVLDDYHKNKTDPNHPAHQNHPGHGQFIRNLPKQAASAGIFGFAASAGSAAFNAVK